MDDFPERAGAELAELRRQGYSFDQAWDRLRSAPVDREWGSLGGGAEGLENPLTFLHRHFRAAYVHKKAAPYCQRHDCTNLAPLCKRP